MPDKRVIAFYEAIKNQCAISSVTWQELIYGVTRMPEGRRKEYVSKCIKMIIDDIEILPYDSFSADICGKALGALEKEGKQLPLNDTQIASTAIANGMVLVTHNAKALEEFAERTFLRVEDWFTA